MKITILAAVLFLSSLLIGCGGGEVDTSREGLDLKSVLTLAKSSTGPEDFEKKLNQADGVNNLDLNEDGQVDYISVDEYGGQGERNLSLYVAFDSNGNKQQIAELNCDAEGCNIVGNDKVYGTTPVYRAQKEDSDTNNFLMYYLLYRALDTPSYRSTYYNYNTPTRYVIRDRDTYSTRVRSTYDTKKINPAPITPTLSQRIASSPNAGKVSPSTTRTSSYSSSYGGSTGSSYKPSSSGTSSSRSTTSGSSSSRSTSSSSSSRSSSSSSSRSSSGRR